MYMNENSHRFPAWVLAAPVSQVVATKASVAQVAVEEADVARLRIDVVATRS